VNDHLKRRRILGNFFGRIDFGKVGERKDIIFAVKSHFNVGCISMLEHSETRSSLELSIVFT
jgi:hypothetical protein